MTLSATEARKLALQNIEGPLIKGYVHSIDRGIYQSIEKGLFQVLPWHHLAAYRSKSPTPEQREAIKQHYIHKGYRWEDHEDPDPGDPRSSAYSTISWG